MPSRIEIARYLAGLHPPGELQVDADAEIAAVTVGEPTGLWVQAWVFVTDEAIDRAMVDDSPIPK